MTTPEQQMSAIELARLLADMGDGEHAIKAYAVAMTAADTQPVDRLEAACAVLQYGDDYKSAYDAFLKLYGEEAALRSDVFGILMEAFYAPNVKKQEKQYKKNCKLLKNYPYLFHKEFLPFEELPVQFFPYDDNGVLPFYKAEERFALHTDINDPVVAHYFFRDLEKPVFARNVFSQYELMYLRDNVRRSDWVAKDNHIYLHYADWGEFCSYLALLDMKPLLEDEKFVFLIGEDESLYPIDFKERFGIDYSQYKVKPFSVREVNKLIWHTQLGFHNGGDFFNEIMDGHPYLLADTSRFLNDQEDMVDRVFKQIKAIPWEDRSTYISVENETLNADVLRELFTLRDLTYKDVFVGVYMSSAERYDALDRNSRVSPALLFQPHFARMDMNWTPHEGGGVTVNISGIEEVIRSPLFSDFKYIKTFTPIRRPTTSLGGTVRFVNKQIAKLESSNAERQSGGDTANEDAQASVFTSEDLLVKFMLNRSFMVDDADRMFHDSRMVRFEDGKINPTATFTALAEFLDIPYCDSMKECTGEAAVKYGNELAAFSLLPVYRTYDEFVDRYERILLEFSLRDAYKKYGYDFLYYDGSGLTQEQTKECLSNGYTVLSFVEKSFRVSRDGLGIRDGMAGPELDQWIENMIGEHISSYREQREIAVNLSQYALTFYSPRGNRLRFMEPLKLDPALLENELYH